MKSAEEIFDGAEPVETSDEPTGEVETEEKPVEEPEVEVAEEPTEETKDASPASEEETKVPISAMHGERDRRKAAERERDELKALQVEKIEPTSVFADEAAFRNEIQSELNQTLTNQSLNQSEFFAAREIGRAKLDEKIEIFKTLAKDNPEIGQRFSNAVSPYHELIEIVDQRDEMEKMEDLPAYKAKLRAEVRAEVVAELKADGDAKTELRDSIPDSLVDEKGKGALDSKPTTFEPKTAEDIFDTPR